jgi:hypothetical protein
MKIVIAELGHKLVAAVVTDNAGNARGSRELIKEIYPHIVIFRRQSYLGDIPCDSNRLVVTAVLALFQLLAKQILMCTVPATDRRRCMMHGIQRSDVLGHSWARSIAKAAQRVVTYFEMSNGTKRLLLKMGLDLGIVGPSLQTSNKTRFTSVCSMLESNDRNAPALKMLGLHPYFAPRQAVARSRGAAGMLLTRCATTIFSRMLPSF